MPPAKTLTILTVIAPIAIGLASAFWLGVDPPDSAAYGDNGSQAALAATPTATPAAPTEAQLLDETYLAHVRPILNTYCYDCHGFGMTEGDIALDRDLSVTTLDAMRDTLTRTSLMMSQRLMPPDGENKPTIDEVQTVTAWIAKALDHCDCSGPPNPGRVAVHRLNRDEYNRTIRDLVGVTFRPADDFPADDTGYGFDNIADVLTMSPLLAEKYLTAAEAVMDEAIVTRLPFESTNAHYRAMDISQGVTGGADNGGFKMWSNAQLVAPHTFPADATYRITIRAWGDQAGPDPAKMRLSIDQNEVTTFDVPQARGDMGQFTIDTYVNEGSRRVGMAFINDYYSPEDPDPSQRDRNLSVLDVAIEGPLDVKAPEPGEVHRRLIIATPTDGSSIAAVNDPDPARDAGSEETASDIAAPAEPMTDIDAARICVQAFADRAFRRPTTDAEIDRLMKLYRLARDRGGNYEEGVQLAMTAALVSPHFLFRLDIPPASLLDTTKAASAAASAAASSDALAGVYDLDPWTLASRLSYFIWGSMPDEALFDAARTGRLNTPAALADQVRRMIADPKADALVSRFAGQWLELRNLDSFTPDAEAFPEFTPALREAMRREAELFFAAIMRENQPITAFLDADFTYINAELAAHYGLPFVDSDTPSPADFQRVALPADSHRGGVLGMAGILTVTSNPTRTSPVKRGKWVLEQLLGTPPPPPPPNTPTLPESSDVAVAGTLRQRFEQHTADVNCAICHRQLDPIGFSLEPFDALGRWRDFDGGQPIDAAGTLPTGETIDGPAGLRQLLASRQDAFVRTFIEKMLTFAIGRGLEHYDRCTVDTIQQATAADQHRLESILIAIVQSEAFRKSRIDVAAEADLTQPTE